MTQRVLSFHRVLSRHHTFLGCEREPAMMLTFACAYLGVLSGNMPSRVIAAAVWFSCMPLLVWMAKSDPQMTRIYQRSLKYRGYYPPHSSPWSK